MKTKRVWLCIVLLCVLGLIAQAETVVTTADGNGADTFIGNDTNKPDTYNYGESEDMDIRYLIDTRSHIGYVRWDITSIGGMDPTGAQLRFWFTYTQSARDCWVYALNDNVIDDNWDEGTISYSTAPGFLPTTPVQNGNFIIDETKMTYLGTFNTGTDDEVALTIDITPEDPNGKNPLVDVIKADTNNKVTLAFICPTNGDGRQFYVRTKEGVAAETDPNLIGLVIPPTLVIPADVNPFWASDPTPAMNEVVTGSLTELCWVNPEPNETGGTITCDVYFGATEPNNLLADYGLDTLATGTTDTCVALPSAPDPLIQYYWVVDVHDSTQPGVTHRGLHWSYNTFNVAPTVDAGEDQYVWLTKEVVNTGSSNDTYIRDDSDRGSMEYMDILYASTYGFGGYLQFDLSGMTSLGSGTLSNATLTLRKVAGSRNDGINNDRFSLYGLLNESGTTPQDWDEHLLGISTVGDEWSWPFNGSSGLVADLDGDVTGISEVIASDVITITGETLDSFLQSRVDENGLVTFIITQEASSGRGYGIATKENSNESYRPNLTLTYVLDGTPNNGDALVDLDGTVTDDGQPYGTLYYLWEQLDGPETISIAPNDTVDTTVTIGTSGTYVFQLTADDGQEAISDTVQVYVGIDPCDAAQNVPGYEANIADLNADCFVDLKDFAMIAAQWLNCDSLECP